MRGVRYLPADDYALVERSVPLVCVDFILVRRTPSGRQIGLILRESPYGEVWCHLGGRIGRGESIAQALQRHSDDTLGVRLDLGPDPQPDHVYQWFPEDDTPSDAAKFDHGVDSRKHAIGLSFALATVGEPTPRNEAIAFDWFDLDALPQPLWPGCERLLRALT